MQTILTVTHAYEILFGHAVSVDVLYRPFVRDRQKLRSRISNLEEFQALRDNVNLQNYNEASRKLFNKTSKYGFDDMRHLFLAIHVPHYVQMTFSEARDYISALPRDRRRMRRVSDEEIEGIENPKLRDLLFKISALKINKLRNQIIHKNAYRPTEEEARTAASEAEHLINRITYSFRLGRTFESYINGRLRDEQPVYRFD